MMLMSLGTGFFGIERKMENENVKERPDSTPDWNGKRQNIFMTLPNTHTQTHFRFYSLKNLKE